MAKRTGRVAHWIDVIEGSSGIAGDLTRLPCQFRVGAEERAP